MAENVLYYGDNLDILQRYIKDETIDLIYLDPPFDTFLIDQPRPNFGLYRSPFFTRQRGYMATFSPDCP